VALTFDAEHPSRATHRPGADGEILDVLGRAGVRATFFLQGRWASAHPALARRVAEEGHVVGNHSHHHGPMTLLSDEGIRLDVVRSAERIAEVTGADPRPWFRCPFGEGAEDPRVLAQLRDLGYRNVHWSIDPGDWREGASPPGVASAVLNELGSSPGGAIVVFHTWPGVTPEAVGLVVDRLAADGATFVTAPEIVDAA
jgi:peptidoglycan/xylan/chitin deacetylase (PgdA/CDA1 family)